MNDSTKLTEKEILDFLYAIEREEITLLAPNGVTFCGEVLFEASNGWSVIIFNDCDEWDYIDWLKTSDGREIRYDEMADTMPLVDDYRPPVAVAQKIYGMDV